MTQETRKSALATAIQLEVLTVAWLALEAAIALGTGRLTRRPLLTTLGLDSIIEWGSTTVLLWRLRAETRRRAGTAPDPLQVEYQATYLSAWLLATLYLYLVGLILAGLLLRLQPANSLLGVAVAATALLVMPVLAWRKHHINQVLGSAALRADVAETLTCGYMAGAVLLGLVLNALGGWWGAEYAAALGLLWWLEREARAAFKAVNIRSTE